MKSAIREMLEALDLAKARPLVHGDRQAIERRYCEGVAFRAQRDSGETETGVDKRLVEPETSQVGPQSKPDLCYAASELDHQETCELMPRHP